MTFRSNTTIKRCVLWCALLAMPLTAQSDILSSLHVDDETIKERTDGILTMMSFTVLPDVTTSTLSIKDGASGNADFMQTTFGGGFTLSEDFPLYLEGTVGYSRYSPSFLTSIDQKDLIIPVKWNSVTLSGGIGWDFPLTEDKELKLRPIFNFMFGHMESDASILAYYLEYRFDIAPEYLEFLHKGSMSAYGLGGAVMLDWEHYRDDYEVDVELRYSKMELKSIETDYRLFQGTSDVDVLSLWTRYRAPTGMTMLDKPLRYVLEGSHTAFFGDQRNALGFNSLTTLGAGFEIDTSDYPVFITRARILYRYTFGGNAWGHSIGLAVSF